MVNHPTPHAGFDTSPYPELVGFAPVVHWTTGLDVRSQDRRSPVSIDHTVDPRTLLEVSHAGPILQHIILRQRTHQKVWPVTTASQAKRIHDDCPVFQPLFAHHILKVAGDIETEFTAATRGPFADQELPAAFSHPTQYRGECED